MQCSDNLRARLRLAGYRLCSSCQEVLDRMDSRGTEWTEQHKKQLARILNANLRRTAGKIPMQLRLRWIERQITIAIRQSRKKGQHPCTH